MTSLSLSFFRNFVERGRVHASTARVARDGAPARVDARHVLPVRTLARPTAPEVEDFRRWVTLIKFMAQYTLISAEAQYYVRWFFLQISRARVRSSAWRSTGISQGLENASRDARSCS